MAPDATLDRFLWPIDVSAISGAATQSITNWRHQGFLDGIGKYDEAAARWNYSIVDSIKIRVINDLATVGVRLPFAVHIASTVDQRVAEVAAGKWGDEPQVIVAWEVNDELTVRRARADLWLADYNHSKPTIVVPIDIIAFEIFNTVALWKAAKGTKAKREALRARRAKVKV
jgi:hypothetical protein